MGTFTGDKPTKCQIGALTYRIKYVIPGKTGRLEEGELGSCCQGDQIICVDKNLSYPMTILVLIHEMLHAIGDAISPNRGPFCKESFTCTVAEFLVQALQSSGLLKIGSSGKLHLSRDKRKGRNEN